MRSFLRELKRRNVYKVGAMHLRPTAQLGLAQVLMRGGDPDGAIENLKATLDLPGGYYTAALLRLDPLWDPLRGNPKFDAFLK